MTTKIPKRLRREPLVEAIWQAVFDTTSTISPPGDLLVGIIYSWLHKSNYHWQFQRLATADIPAFLSAQDPHLRFTAKYRIESPKSPIVYQIGDRIISVHCRRPYTGWEVFRDKIIDLQQLLSETAVIPSPFYQSLRYINLIEQQDMSDLRGLRLAIRLGDQDVINQPIHFRIETNYYNFTHILQIATHAHVRLAENQSMEGTVIDLETRAVSSPNWSDQRDQLEAIHLAAKTMFFEQVVADDLVCRLQPEYE
ncbi:MAG: TIGR04255 family protein [Gemmataceae bacterium]|nr:TIGR04255 family protein [Gemmataceae bacterium]MDW8243708.1 TIGR04255 family protein [Thermogemmata sp.]